MKKAPEIVIAPPKAIVGLGNPGTAYTHTRHNIGFLILDALADRHGGIWRSRDKMDFCEITLNTTPVLLVKPQTYMNSSGQVYPYLAKQGIKAESMLIVHDEMEFPFGKVSLRVGGSARGHNGLKSFISVCGDGFARLRFGIGRPDEREQVSDYVLEKFKEPARDLENALDASVSLIEKLYRE
ncbi:aminoacyl-tRNA hydrolase [Candidatus Dependentiae bacterium]|nr:aminoacyl-tRNA hydrolase [Candidatus Dependentiae bacterium]